MPIAINFKICDNSPDCLALPVCPVKAFYFDNKKKTLVIDNSKCINCGVCENVCQVGAIRFAKTQEEFQQIQKEIANDPRKVSDLFVDRYGAEPQAGEFFCSKEKFDIQILQATKPAVIECFDENSIHCLVESIPIKKLFEGKNILYRKFAVEEESFKERYSVKELPCLLFFDKGRLIAKIEGFFSHLREEELKKQINKYL